MTTTDSTVAKRVDALEAAVAALRDSLEDVLDRLYGRNVRPTASKRGDGDYAADVKRH